MTRLKRDILKKLKAMERAIKGTNMRGQLSLSYTGIHPDKWDAMLESITEYSRTRHIISIEGVQVYLLLN